MNHDYSKWAVPCLVREIGRKWPDVDLFEGLMSDMQEDEGFMGPNRTLYTMDAAKRFMKYSQDWNTEEALSIKASLKSKLNAWVIENALTNPHATTARL